MAAALLHVAVILFLLLFAREHMPPEQSSPPGIAVVFQNGGQPQTTAPPTPLKGPSTPAQTPPPPTPPQTAQSQPSVHLDLPETPLAETPQSALDTEFAPQPMPRPRPHVRPRPKPPQRYVVMNNMSYGNQTSPSPPAHPAQQAQRALNLALPESDAQAANGPELTIKGEIGADWNAALSQWVNTHKYYPQAALEQNQQGSVEIEFTVDRAGNVTQLHMLSGSGSPFLDQAWLGLFAQNQLPPFPPGTKSSHITVDATMHYELLP